MRHLEAGRAHESNLLFRYSPDSFDSASQAGPEAERLMEAILEPDSNGPSFLDEGHE